MGVKSRLGVAVLSDAVKREMDTYLDTVVPRIKNPEREQVAAYEKLYDLPQTPLDLSHSAEIEQASWETTKRLVEAFEEAEAPAEPMQALMPAPIPTVGANHDSPVPVSTVEANVDLPADQGDDALKTALVGYLPFMRATAACDTGAQMAFCRTAGKMIDAVADEINGIAVEVFGDVILEEGDGGYVIIDDYGEQLRSLWEE